LPQTIDDLFPPDPGGTRIRIEAKPKSKSFRITISDKIIINCRSPPEKGKANKEILKELSKIFDRRVRILSGHRSKSKTILVEAIKPETARNILFDLNQSKLKNNCSRTR